MRRSILVFALAAIVLGQSACYKDMIIVDKNYDPSRSTPDRADVELSHTDILGIIPLTGPVNLRGVCKGKGAGIVQVKTNVFLGIVNFHKSYIYCTVRRAEAPQLKTAPTPAHQLASN